MKKFLRNFFIFLIIILMFTNIPGHIEPVKAATNSLPQVPASSSVLIDARTGQVLYANNENEQFSPASTTKIMTALIVLENFDLSEEVTIGANPPHADGSSIGIREGEVYTIEQLLIGLLLTSGNDCAEALAEYVSGSNAEFGKLMTERAISIGAKNTTFKNPSGLDEEGHVTTAYDLALIMREAANNADFVRISQMQAYKYVDQPYHDGTEKWSINHNPLMQKETATYYYPNSFTGKTGYTSSSKHCYAAAAKQDDQILIGAFLKAEDKNAVYASMSELFNYGFNNFKTSKIIQAGEAVSEYKINKDITIPLLADKDYYVTRKINDPAIGDIQIDYDDIDLTKQSISKNEKLINARILIDGEYIEDIQLLSGADREYNTKIAIIEYLNSIFSTKIIPISVIVVILLLFLLIIRYKIKHNRRRRLMHMRKKFNIK